MKIVLFVQQIVYAEQMRLAEAVCALHLLQLAQMEFAVLLKIVISVLMIADAMVMKFVSMDNAYFQVSHAEMIIVTGLLEKPARIVKSTAEFVLLYVEMEDWRQVNSAMMEILFLEIAVQIFAELNLHVMLSAEMGLLNRVNSAMMEIFFLEIAVQISARLN
jgi:hypothetical protein